MNYVPIALYDWTPPVRRECLRCGRWYKSREAPYRCPLCGFTETPD